MKKVLYQGSMPATFGVAGAFEFDTQKEVDDDVAALLLGKDGFSLVVDTPAPKATKATHTTTD